MATEREGFLFPDPLPGRGWRADRNGFWRDPETGRLYSRGEAEAVQDRRDALRGDAGDASGAAPGGEGGVG
jgi:hypothetical protein